jgi:type III secretory pathway component EscV
MVYTYYNITNLTSAGNQTTILTFVGEVNSIMGGFPALLMLIAVGIVILLILIRQGTDIFRSFAAASFVMMVLALITYPMQLIGGTALLVFITLCPVSIFLLWVWGGKTIG